MRTTPCTSQSVVVVELGLVVLELLRRLSFLQQLVISRVQCKKSGLCDDFQLAPLTVNAVENSRFLQHFHVFDLPAVGQSADQRTLKITLLACWHQAKHTNGSAAMKAVSTAAKRGIHGAAHVLPGFLDASVDARSG